MPGVLVGIDLPSLPGLPGLALAVERTSFAGTCCGNPIWYRHSTFWDGWTQDGRPLGHPLGGHGHEWAVRSRLHLNDARLRVNADAFVRDRGNENLYADVRNGSSTGGTIGLEADIKDGLRLLGEGLMEDGEGWREVRLMVALRAFL